MSEMWWFEGSYGSLKVTGNSIIRYSAYSWVLYCRHFTQYSHLVDSTAVVVFSSRYFSFLVPCAIKLALPSVFSARKYIISYRIVSYRIVSYPCDCRGRG